MRAELIFITVAVLATGCHTSNATHTSARALPVRAPVLSAETRAEFEKNLAEARAEYEKDRESADAIIWLGRRTAYLGRYAEAIEIFTEGIRLHPGDARMLRHRGHRWITLRQFERASGDFERAAALVRGRADEIEPDGLPNARNIPTTTLQSNIWYHLGLARYLQRDFEGAERAFRECLAVSKNDDGLVSASYWLYSTLRRQGRREDAARVLEPVRRDMDIIENDTYHQLLLMAKGERAPSELLEQNADSVAGSTILYGVGNWYLYNGEPERARAIFDRIVSGSQWASFGYIAAEAELKH